MVRPLVVRRRQASRVGRPHGGHRGHVLDIGPPSVMSAGLEISAIAWNEERSGPRASDIECIPTEIAVARGAALWRRAVEDRGKRESPFVRALQKDKG